MGLLADKDPKVRLRAATALAYIGDPRGIKRLVDMLATETDGQLLILITQQLSDIRPYADIFIKQLNSSDHFAKMNAVGALGNTHDPKYIDLLVKAAQDPALGIRQRALGALGKIPDPRVIAPILEGLKDPQRMGRYLAVETLLKLQNEPWLNAYPVQKTQVKKALEDNRTLVDIVKNSPPG